MSIGVLNEIESGVQPPGVRPVVQARVANVVILGSENALSQNDPFQSIIGFEGPGVKEKRGLTEPSDRRIPDAALAQRPGGVRKHRSVGVMPIMPLRC